jgi:hypothetical protein
MERRSIHPPGEAAGRQRPKGYDMRPTANASTRRFVLIYLFAVLAFTALFGSIDPQCLNPGVSAGGDTAQRTALTPP